MVQRQVTFVEAITMALTQNYCNFTGRASRAEYWWYCLFNVILSTILTTNFGNGTVGLIVSGIVSLALFLPGLGLAVRRLHDIGKSGWWLLLGIVPLIGWIILIVWYVKPSQESTNEYGEIPNLVNA